MASDKQYECKESDCPEMDQDVLHYEDIRNKNLEDNKSVLAKLMSDLSDHMPMPRKVPSTGSTKRMRIQDKDDPSYSSLNKRRSSTSDSCIRRNPSRRARCTPNRFDLPYSKPRYRSGSVSSNASSVSSSSPGSSPEKNKLVVRFGFFKKSEAPKFLDEEYTSDVESESEEDFPVIKMTRNNVREIKSVEDITKEDLENVADKVRDKKYDAEFGTSCHQCRQKTTDMKTICRSSSCLGVRGPFCGVCLRNRYGEDARESLLDPAWACPPCRGICNCSICRNRSKKGATGILIHVARENGYNDVSSYLRGLKVKKS